MTMTPMQSLALCVLLWWENIGLVPIRDVKGDTKLLHVSGQGGTVHTWGLLWSSLLGATAKCGGPGTSQAAAKDTKHQEVSKSISCSYSTGQLCYAVVVHLGGWELEKNLVDMRSVCLSSWHVPESLSVLLNPFVYQPQWIFFIIASMTKQKFIPFPFFQSGTRNIHQNLRNSGQEILFDGNLYFYLMKCHAMRGSSSR